MNTFGILPTSKKLKLKIFVLIFVLKLYVYETHIFSFHCNLLRKYSYYLSVVNYIKTYCMYVFHCNERMQDS
jgi:hypothetical protein